MNQIHILLADDHPVVRAGVRAFLHDEPDMMLVGEAATASQAVALAQELHPDIAILDISMPGDGLEATRQIRIVSPNTQVLILTFHTQGQFLLHALQAGAAGYLLKSVMDDDLIKAIRAVFEGGVFLTPPDIKLLVNVYKAQLTAAPTEAGDSLSERERQIIRLIALGHTTSEVAELLTLSPKSVETYRTRLMQKLGIHNRVDLVQYALLHNLLEDNPE